MELIDKQLAELEAIDVPTTKRADFDDFWTQNLQKCKDVPLNIKREKQGYPISSMVVEDLTFDGLDGTSIRGWLLMPAERQGQVPVVICYHGATGSRQYPHCFAHWVAAGAAVLTYDFRLQGGLTGSNSGFACGSKSFTYNIQGITDRDNSYLYHVCTDALRAVEVALAIEEIDNARICVNGGSQGGATSLTVSGLHPAVSLAMADVPSRCWLEKRLYDRSGGYGKMAEFLRDYPDKLDTVCEVLSYYDNINFAPQITCPILVSVGLKDPVCPPANVYAAYNKIPEPKEIIAYPFGEHDGGGIRHEDVKLRYFAKHFLK